MGQTLLSSPEASSPQAGNANVLNNEPGTDLKWSLQKKLFLSQVGPISPKVPGSEVIGVWEFTQKNLYAFFVVDQAMQEKCAESPAAV